jgi:hypothetical protein
MPLYFLLRFWNLQLRQKNVSGEKIVMNVGIVAAIGFAPDFRYQYEQERVK